MRQAPQAPWLDPTEQEELVRLLLTNNLIKFSNRRDLPLKSGGKTDVYINLRDARNNPAAIKAIARAFENPLRRLGPDRFIEIPDSVSCFAGPLAIATGIPYITIREAPKAGRVAKAASIGQAPFGSSAAIIDDVVTDGESKIIPFLEAKELGLAVRELVVLVDRQQGWRKKFAERGIDLAVWPGMTLHDVRKLLVSQLGIMQRCDPETEKTNCIIVALDGKSWEETLAIADPLRPSGAILKVNDLLFDKGIASLIPDLQVYGRVMADLKCHDIPNTVKNTCERLRACPPWAVTVHASGGPEMVSAAVEALKGTPTKVLAITVLTSINEATSEEIFSRRPAEEVAVLAKMAAEAGAHGFVCSPQEVKMLKDSYPDKTIVTPGIRSDGTPKDDQARIATPKAAKENGADFLVMGRQILGAPDPVAEVKRVMTEELA
ncbi:MAG: Orotidine 5'-phosphate decarboxylase [Candidatus Jorgensenbacteria bacterium GW2011_GWA1_48_11]|uniref:Orotidine 5'-phosphate decarboxylase n=1 Tax=Candidatus Jorgensenbacteria bacterium GW2011_GWA1_48_11 TaxID=1618660 RepID=A0A0G1UAA8_9BACT|nr:MAG: Orotidine 5'-phosphate decarboxylase [Candidatus Jorgensenbacteria bacterium GW2011_GWA1_48_11]KKW11810.1 MAG: Orotidine 5'-phosphate decarboxylase [Candidatus Jorgensenbacteria bacterium GW2011_GWB1_49_9]